MGSVIKEIQYIALAPSLASLCDRQEERNLDGLFYHLRRMMVLLCCRDVSHPSVYFYRLTRNTLLNSTV
jgi:hypothetical protein